MPASSLKHHFLRFATDHGLFGKGDRVLVALSGGVDSVVLLPPVPPVPSPPPQAG